MIREVPSNHLPVACFAVPLTEERLAKYASLIAEHQPGEIQDALQSLYNCVRAWWELPESRREPYKWSIKNQQGETLHYNEVPLEEGHVKQLDSVTPWMREIMTLSNSQSTGLLDSLPQGEICNMAHDLIWYAKEITLDREPLTQDKLVKA